jgi:hypothetical protein
MAKKNNKSKQNKQQGAFKKPLDKNIKKGGALRTRDEHLQGGKPKSEYADNPKQYYRVIYVVDINSGNDLAVVRRTTKKGRHLKSQPQYKFHEEVYVKDNKGKPIKINDKFVRSSIDDITKTDVDYILKRCYKYPDTAGKMNEFKGRGKKKPPKK